MSSQVDDVRAAAERFIARFGDAAPDEAQRRAKELAAAGHDEAAREWDRIAELVRGLLARPQDASDWRH